jgi:hypothetical protein
MKFYVNNHFRIEQNKLTAIDFDCYYVRFFENGIRNNKKMQPLFILIIINNFI